MQIRLRCFHSVFMVRQLRISPYRLSLYVLGARQTAGMGNGDLEARQGPYGCCELALLNLLNCDSSPGNAGFLKTSTADDGAFAYRVI